MSQPVLEYYWIKVLLDGKTIIPQFDFDTGKQNAWGTDNIPLSKVLLKPFDPDLAEKVIASGNPALASTNPTIEFIVEPDDIVEAGIYGTITQTDPFRCDICGWVFMHTDGSKFAKCPQCGSQDDWYCSRCKEFKTEFRITDKGQVQCLDCDIPVGLDRNKKLFRQIDIKHSCDYFVKTQDRQMIVTDDGRIINEKIKPKSTWNINFTDKIRDYSELELVIPDSGKLE